MPGLPTQLAQELNVGTVDGSWFIEYAPGCRSVSLKIAVKASEKVASDVVRWSFLLCSRVFSAT